MRRGLDRTRISELSVTKRIVKTFVINCHSPALEDFEVRLESIVQQGSCEKIMVVNLKPTGTAQWFKSNLSARQLAESIDKAGKQMEGMWKSLKTDLESAIWMQWLQSVGRKSRKEKDDKIPSPKELSKTKPAGPAVEASEFSDAEQREEFDEGEEEEEEVEEIPNPCLIPRLVPNADMSVLCHELRIRDLVMPDYYMLIFCKTPTDLIKELVRLGVVLTAVIHFIPCPVSELEAQFPAVFDDIQELKKCNETKNIGVFTSSLSVESLIESDPVETYEQFKAFLFDIEMLSQHFILYQSDFLENSDVLTSKEKLIRAFQVHSSKEYSDNTAVCVYFDNLCRMVETHTTNERRYSSFHPRPFLDNDYGKIIVEDANDLLKSAIATEMNLVSYWKAVEIVINAIRQSPSDGQCSGVDMKLPLFNELLSWESFAQRMEMVKEEYDSCYRKDLAEKFKIFVLRRTFHKILESTRKYHLPTKLCFRDFCSYIAPGYVDVLRRRGESSSVSTLETPQEDEGETEESFSAPSDTGREIFFSGLTFDDTFQELTVVEKLYRFHRSGCIRAKLENWMYKERKLTVEINLFDCDIFAHRWDENLPTLFPRVRIISGKGITCNVDMSEDPTRPCISIQWPNDCQIRYVREIGVGAVEQRYYWATIGEYKRVYTNKGCVLVYLRNGDINVLTPNGIFYQLYPTEYPDPDSLSEPKPLSSTNISIELKFVKRLTAYGIECRCFDVTKNDGRKIRVRNGVAVEERARYLVYEWMDLGFGEMFAERDDGVKLISSYYGLKTYYPCGTMIHTVTEEEYVELDLDCRSLSTDNILRKINPDIIRWMDEKRPQRKLWLSFNLTYHVRHERYASITCYEETKMIIQSPDDVKVIVSDDAVMIDLGNDANINVSLRLTPDACTITSSYDNDMSIKLHLLPNDGEILYYQSTNAKVTLKEDGQFISDDDYDPITPYDEELYLMTKQYKFGVAFIPKYEFDAIVKKYKHTPYFYETPKKVVILKNILPINERFSMPIRGMDVNLDKLNMTKCRGKYRERCSAEMVFSARTIFKLNNSPPDLYAFLTCYNYIEIILSDNIQDALDYWFAPKPPKDKYSRAWKKKIRDTVAEMRKNKERAPVYHAMMQHKVFPKYHEFLEAKCDVDNLNLKKLIPELVKKGFKDRSNFK